MEQIWKKNHFGNDISAPYGQVEVLLTTFLRNVSVECSEI